MRAAPSPPAHWYAKVNRKGAKLQLWGDDGFLGQFLGVLGHAHVIRRRVAALGFEPAIMPSTNYN